MTPTETTQTTVQLVERRDVFRGAAAFYELSATPATLRGMRVFLNGLLQDNNADLVVSGQRVTFTLDTEHMQETVIVQAFYWVAQ